MGPLEVDSSGVEPGDCFPIGTETVTYTFTDLAQNSATCIFTVEVAIVGENYSDSYSIPTIVTRN